MGAVDDRFRQLVASRDDTNCDGIDDIVTAESTRHATSVTTCSSASASVPESRRVDGIEQIHANLQPQGRDS